MQIDAKTQRKMMKLARRKDGKCWKCGQIKKGRRNRGISHVTKPVHCEVCKQLIRI